MTSRKLALTCLLAAMAATAQAQPGSAGFQVLRLGYSARDLSLAGSLDAVTREPVALFLNPAGLTHPQDTTGIGLNIMLTHRSYIAGTTIDMFATRFDAGGFSFGTGLLLSTVPDIEARISPGDPAATFSAKDFAFAAGVARSFGSIDAGISALYLYEKLFVYESTGFAFNAGVECSPLDGLDVGVSAGNMGSSSGMISERISLPLFFRAGGSYALPLEGGFSVRGSVGVVTFKSGGVTPSAGIELTYFNLITLRSGYATGSDLTGYSFGGGISYGSLRFDYSYIPMKLDFGNSQTFTLAFVL